MTRAEILKKALRGLEASATLHLAEYGCRDAALRQEINGARSALAQDGVGQEPELVTCGMYRHGAALGLRHVAQADCFNPKPATSSPAAEQPDPKDLEITERDRWAWRLGWSAAMSIRLDRPVNPSDAPEPPATAPRPGEG